MPDRYQAAKVTNAQVADLSRLSMSTTSSSLIEPEDVVDVTISSGLEEAGRITPTPVRVGNTGIATIALIGQVPLAGLEPFQAEQRIATAAIDRGLFQSASGYRHDAQKSCQSHYGCRCCERTRNS